MFDYYQQVYLNTQTLYFAKKNVEISQTQNSVILQNTMSESYMWKDPHVIISTINHYIACFNSIKCFMIKKSQCTVVALTHCDLIIQISTKIKLFH